MKRCSSRQQPACTAGARHSRSNKCLWSCEGGSCAFHPQPAETPGGTGKQEVLVARYKMRNALYYCVVLFVSDLFRSFIIIFLVILTIKQAQMISY